MSPVSDPFPLITIAIPTRNRAQFIQDCVTAALAQSYHRFEIFVSDNASIDETPSKLQKLKDPRLRVVRHEKNIGLLPNWNYCLQEARGDYVVFVSDDDIIRPQLLERCVQQLRFNPQLQVVITLCDIYFHSSDRLISTPSHRELQTGIYSGEDVLIEYLRGRIISAMCSTMIKTTALRAAGGFPTDMPHAGDIAAWSPLILGTIAGFVNESCAVYCRHPSSQTDRLDLDARLRDVRRVADMITQLADQHKRDVVGLEANRWFMCCLIAALAQCRRGGGTFGAVASLGLRWRQFLRPIPVRDFPRLARPLAVTFAPLSVARLLRRSWRPR